MKPTSCLFAISIIERRQRKMIGAGMQPYLLVGLTMQPDQRGKASDPDALRALWFPRVAAKPLIPVHIVCGPPSAGKSTYVAFERSASSIVIDLDEIASKLAGEPLHQFDMTNWWVPALEQRNMIVDSLACTIEADEAWLILTAASRTDRRWWRDTLAADSVTVVETRSEICIRRIESSDRYDAANVIEKVHHWWNTYVSDLAEERQYRGANIESRK